MENYESDSDKELPELFRPQVFDKANLLKGDVVWALYKNKLYWPALIRDVDKKKKKVRIWYLDSPGTCFKVPFSKIHDFADAKFTKKVQEDAKSVGSSEDHTKVLKKAEIYLFRGKRDDPLKLFDSNCHDYFLQAKLSEMELNNKIVSTGKIDNLKKNPIGKSDVEIDVESSTPSKYSMRDNKDLLEKSSEGESSFVKNDVDTCTSTKYSPGLEEDSPYDDEMVDKILSHITSGHVNDYLVNVANSNIPNERHNLYLEAMKKDQLALFWGTQSSVLISTEKLHPVTVYLNDLYERKIGKGMSQTGKYIISVWLPEAVNKAVSFIEAESLKQSNSNNESSFEAGTSQVHVNSSASNLPAKRKFNPSSVDSLVIDTSELDTPTRYKKKSTGRKIEKGRSKGKYEKKTNRKRDKRQKEILGVNIAESETSFKI